jgi:hypothetical protein
MGGWQPVRMKQAGESGAHRQRGRSGGKQLRGKIVRVRPVTYVCRPFRCNPALTVEVHHDDIRRICGFEPDTGMQYLICDHQFHAD